jgi:hypothetical protein
MFKNFKLRFLGEAGALQFRAEGFNIINHTNFDLPAANITNADFGVISGTVGQPRILQFALKLSF